MRNIFLIFLLLCPLYLSLTAQVCSTEQHELIIKITTDRIGRETSWILGEVDSLYREVKRNDYQGVLTDIDTFCIRKEACLSFSIFDGFGDGILDGGYELFLNGDLIAQNGDFGFTETIEINCQEGTACSQSIPVVTGTHETIAKNSWYSFTPDTVGTYEIATCGNTNCDTKIWVYDRCESVQIGDSEGFIFFNDNACNQQSIVNALLDVGLSYIIRIQQMGDCANQSISWNLTYQGPIRGCMDPNSCNYNPLATLSDNSCLPLGNPNCPKGPDLRIREDILLNSLAVDLIENEDDCLINEGCLTGFGTREIIRFTTRFENIGEQDYYIGIPSNESPQFTFDNCHNHFHYDNYAEYVLYDEQGNRLPAGFKSGFCVVDLVCTDGKNKYGCNNMGLTVGCHDEYLSTLDCQWIDVTDYPDGNYTFIARVNWGNQPDFLGRIEQDLSNNWSQVCLTLNRNSGKLVATIKEDCPDFTDCEGTLLGGVEKDCQGICGGTALYADVDGNTIQDRQDVTQYFSMILEEEAAITPCNDLNNDQSLTVYDAALLADCLNFGSSHTHSQQGVHNHCDFPAGIFNSLDTVAIKIHAFNELEQTIDLAILNRESAVIGFQMQLAGITIKSTESLIDTVTFPVQLQTNISEATILALSTTKEGHIPKSRDYQPFLRIHYLEVKDPLVCLQSISDIVNSDIQQVVTVLEESCLSTMTTSSPSILNSPHLKIFPNPTQHQCILSFPNPNKEAFNVSILDATSKLVQYHTGITTNRFLLDSSHLPTGIYFLRLHSKQQLIVEKLLIL